VHRHLVKAKPQPHVNPGLLELAGVPVLNYWLQAVVACRRLNPASQKVTRSNLRRSAITRELHGPLCALVLKCCIALTACALNLSLCRC
jgi:hypothetical protein